MQKRLALALGLLLGLSSFGQTKAFEVDIRFFTPCGDPEITFVESLCEQYMLDISWTETFQGAKLTSPMAFSPSELVLQCLEEGIIVAVIESSFNYFKNGDIEIHKQATPAEVKKKYATQFPQRYKAGLSSPAEVLRSSELKDHPSVKAILEAEESEK